jgi:hypothetical protein
MAAKERHAHYSHLSLSAISVLLALALAAWEVYFFWEGGRNLLGPLSGFLWIFSPDRLGFDMAWFILFYLSFQLISIPFALGHRDQFIGVLDGLSSVVPLMVAVVAIASHPEMMRTEGRWEAAILLVLVNLSDLIGGFAITIALSRRAIGFGSPVRA